MRRQALALFVLLSACSSTVIIVTSGDGGGTDGAAGADAQGDVVGLDVVVSDAIADGALDGGSDSGSPLTCPLVQAIPNLNANECRYLEDQACNPAWPCWDGGYAYHYTCAPSWSGLPFANQLGVPTCGRLDASTMPSWKDYCCTVQRATRDLTLDNGCPKIAGHDWNWACPKVDGGIVWPHKYDGGANAICSPNATQPDPKVIMMCCDDPNP